VAMMMPEVPRDRPQSKPPRTRLRISVGNVLELAGAGVGCYAIDQLAGLRWALVAAAVLLIVGAELIYDALSLSLPLPRVPHPVAKVRRTLAKVHIPRPGVPRLPHLPRVHFPSISAWRARRVVDWRLLRKGVWPW